MHHQSGFTSRSRGQKARGKIQRDPIQMNFSELPQANISIRHECQGCQEMLTELSVCDPRLAFFQDPERGRIQKHGSSPVEREIEGRPISKRHSVRHGGGLQ